MGPDTVRHDAITGDRVQADICPELFTRIKLMMPPVGMAEPAIILC